MVRKSSLDLKVTTTLRCKKGETAIECAERHKAAGWDVPGGYKLGSDEVGPILEW
jgi:hypothetical protein